MIYQHSGKNLLLCVSRARFSIRLTVPLNSQRNYAAPEIRAGLRRAVSFVTLNSSSHSKNMESNGTKAKQRRSLAACVSSYGMVADSFSG